MAAVDLDGVGSSEGSQDDDGALRLTGGLPYEYKSSLLEKFKGACMHLMFSAFWVGGAFTPFIVLALLYGIGGWVGKALTGAIAFIIVYPYIVRVREWPAFRRAIPGWGQHYHRQVAYHMEAPHEVLAGSNEGLTPGTLMCYHPHGVLSWSFILNGGFRKEFEPGLGLVVDGLYHTPFFRWFIADWTKAVQAANKPNFQRLMKSKALIGLIPGGLEEATISCKGKDRVYLKARKGFIKYALEFGYTIVPVYCFGECDTYHNLQGLWRLRLWLNSLKMPGVCFWGTWWCPLLPIPSNINTVFGKPFRVPQIDHPTPEDINKWHALYVQELKALYDRHKHQFASNPNQELEVW
eukprot:TRINITY_DN325_c0_g3_i4.p1 TRINITY_DN325_c0_g3~~TRINITY_DN325_c0_g3_i4.p1  ORF type:complete len:351 (-),score=64.56 TRINITY_DN325_c0_g3_i4:234-1286(-)